MLHKTGLPPVDLSWSTRRPLPLGRWMDRLRTRRLRFAPGTGHDGSYAGWWLAGYIVERASGMSYSSYLRRSIFRPVGIRTARGFTGSCGSTRPYVRNHSGRLERVTYRQRPLATPDPAMGLCMTVVDYARFDAGLRAGHLLSDRSVAEIFGRQPSRGTWNYGWLRVKPGGMRTPGEPRPKDVWFAVGGHGWAPGYYTIVERFPAEGISVALFTNTGANGRAFPYAHRIANFALRDRS
jgi:CubicO group peptidase (beta-lactamase class C family)